MTKDLVFVGACAACALAGYWQGLRVGDERNEGARSVCRLLCVLLREFDDKLGGPARLSVALGVPAGRPPAVDTLKIFASKLAGDAFLAYDAAKATAERTQKRVATSARGAN